MTRFKATGLHLLISLLLATILISLMLALWYPNAYFKLMGGKKLIFLVGTVDVFLGPLLTFIVFKTDKKSLKFDLLCIATLQAAAMSYGLFVMFQARPVFTVFNKTSFHVVSVVDIAPKELALAKKNEWRTLPITGPKLVAIGSSDKSNKEEKAFASAVSETAFRYPKLYDDYKKHQTEVIKAGKPLDELAAFNAANALTVDKFIKEMMRPMSDFLYLPVESMVDKMVVIVEAKTGAFIQIIDAESLY